MKIHRPSAAFAVGLLLLAPVLGVGVAVIGAVAHVAETAPVEHVTSGRLITFGLCASGSIACGGGESASTLSASFIPPAGFFLVTIGAQLAGGSIDEISPTGRVLTNLSAPCSPIHTFYPGSGDSAFITCEAYQEYTHPNGSWYVVVSAKVLDFNWSSHAIEAVWDLHSTAACDNFGSTIGVNGTELFCATGYPETSVLVVDLRDGSVVANFSVPSDPDYFASVIVWDGSADRLLLQSTDGTHLLVIDPRTGSVDGRLAFPGLLGPSEWDPSTGRLLVGWTNATPGSEFLLGGNVSVLNGTDFDPMYVFPATGLWYNGGWFFPDPRQGTVLVTPGLTVVNVSSGVSLGTLPAPNGFTQDPEALSFDAATGTFLFGLNWGYDPSASEVNATFAWVPGPPYSAIPLVGAALPTLVAIVPALVGAIFLVPELRRVARGRRAAWSDGATTVRALDRSETPAAPRER